jgi:hypothetical protein
MSDSTSVAKTRAKHFQRQEEVNFREINSVAKIPKRLVQRFKVR